MGDKPVGVQVTTCSAKELLCAGSTDLPERGQQNALRGSLRIPEYQRPYRWQAKQIKRLIDDIVEHCAPKSTRLDKGLEEKDVYTSIPYYFGSAIFHRDTEGNLNIIDGQQRITSLALLAQVASNSLSCDLTYTSPVSQRQITQNLQWLACLSDTDKGVIDEISLTSWSSRWS